MLDVNHALRAYSKVQAHHSNHRTELSKASQVVGRVMWKVLSGLRKTHQPVIKTLIDSNGASHRICAYSLQVLTFKSSSDLFEVQIISIFEFFDKSFVKCSNLLS